MKIKDLTPWNWFHSENGESGKVPVGRTASNHPIFRLQSELDQLMNDAFKGFGFPSLLGDKRLTTKIPELLTPQLDIAESDERYTITVEVPGVEQDDINVDIRDNVLTISGEKKADSEEKNDKYHWVERSYGSFRRSLTLPENANADRVDAKFNNGVLNIEIEKKEVEESSVKKISINK